MFFSESVYRGFSLTAEQALNFCFATAALFGLSADIWGMSWLRLQLSESVKVWCQQDNLLTSYSSDSA